MKFRKYNSIDNLTNKLLERFSSEQNKPWVVLEKFDGSNTSVTFDKDFNMKIGRRNDFLYSEQEETSHFKANTVIRKKYEAKLSNAANEIFGRYSDLEGIIFYGELVGTPIFKRVKYLQDGLIDFIVYDIFGITKFNNPSKQLNRNQEEIETNIPLGYYFSHTIVTDIGYQMQYPTAPILFLCNNLNDAIKYSMENLEKDSLGYNEFACDVKELNIINGNIREGHVLKLWGNDSCNNGGKRIIIKHKGKQFEEKSKRSHKKQEFTIKEFTLDYPKTMSEAKDRILLARFYSVISKFGQYSIKDFQVLAILMVEDIIEELIREALWLINQKEEQEFKKNLMKLVSAFFVKSKEKIF